MGSIIRCPHCGGDGYREISDVSYGDYMQAEARECRLCRGERSIELPVTPEQAECVYESADSAETEALVQQSWDLEGLTDCSECTVLRRCDDCYREMISW